MIALDYDGLNMMGSKVRAMADNSQSKLIDMMVSGYGANVIYGWLAQFCGIHRLDIDYNKAAPPEPERYARISEDALNEATENMLEAAQAELRERWSCLQ